MTKDTTPENENISSNESEPEGVHRHNAHRRHGYRGYPNNTDVGGAIHSGTGFGGVGAEQGSGAGTSGIFTEKTREDVEELGEDDERK